MANTYTSTASLPMPIDESQIFQDFENLQAAYASSMGVLDDVLGGYKTISAGNATVINTSGKRTVFINAISAGSISTITGMKLNVPFMLVAQSGASFGIVDTGVFALTASMIFTADDILELVWDGTRYREVGRSAS